MSSGPLPVVFRILAVLIAVIGFYKFFFADDSPTRKVVFITKELGIAGEVTGFNKARGYKIYIDSGDTPYNFDSFENQRILPNTSLGYYLERGDHVEKKPNTDTVTVRRKDQVSKWYLVEPQAQP